MSPKRVIVGAIGMLGAYLFLVRLAGVARIEPASLPYVAEVAGALVVGGALARQGTRHRFEALVAGVLGVAIVAAVAFASPSTFGWVAARSSHPWPIALALAAGCAATGYAGASLAYGRGGLISIAVLSTGVTSGMVLFGSRIVAAALAGAVTIGQVTGLAIIYVCAAVAGFAVQSIVPVANAGACASGTAILVALQVIDGEVNGPRTSGFLWLFVAVVAAFVGALAAQGVRPKPQDPAAVTAFD